jgi:hypothetical protein
MSRTRMIRVHVGLSRELQDRVSKDDGALKQLKEEIGLTGTNTSRLGSFGIITGMAEPSHLDEIRKCPGVDFVEEDTVRKAI